MDDREQILEAVESRRTEILVFLQKLIQHESVTGKETEIQSFIAGHLTRLGMEVDRFEPDPEKLRHYPGFLEPELPCDGRENVVGIRRGTGGGRSILLNGHADSVPVEPLDQWVSDPLSGEIREGRIWGRGASDMKAGVAAMTMAVTILEDIGLRTMGDVILEYVVDEERTGLGTLACVDRGYRADGGLAQNPLSRSEAHGRVLDAQQLGPPDHCF